MDLTFRTRKEWGAKESLKAYKKHQPYRITIHHAYVPTIALFQGDSTIKDIQNYHIKVRQFIDIAYHYIIAPNDIVYECRPVDVYGAHVKGNNFGNIGIMFVGDFDKEDVPESMFNICIELCTQLSKKYYMEIEDIKGHRDYTLDKTCPGENLYKMLPELRKKIK